MDDFRYVLNDPDRLDFRVHRGALVDPAVLEREMRRIFDACWIYAGHESEVREPGDFVTRTICGRPVMVCRERKGNAKGYTCFYDGWSYDRDGCLDGVPGASSYPASFERGEFGLAS